MNSDLITFKIDQVISETPDVHSYILSTHSTLSFLPGQFLTFLFSINGKDLRRSYSIVSLPGEPVKVTVKRMANGEISRYVALNWTTGALLTAIGPAGRFNLEPVTYKRDVFCFAAGSGITAILPQIRSLLIKEPQSTIHLAYSNVNEQNTIFLNEIDHLADTFTGKLIVDYFFSDPVSRLGSQRRLNNGSLEEFVNAALKFPPADAAFLVCGPFSYMRMVRITLIFMRFEKSRILREIFQPEGDVILPVKTRNYPEKTIKINVKGRIRHITVKSGESILRAAMAAGLPLPYSCEGGVCSTCMAVCRSGKVEMTINEVLTEKDLQGGWVLTCTGHPLSDDVEIGFL